MTFLVDIKIFLRQLRTFFFFSDDVVSELIPLGPHRSPNDVHERREIHFEHNKLPNVGLRKLQVSEASRAN